MTTLLFHHVPRTGGSIMRHIIETYHHVPVEPCYTDPDIVRIVRLYSSGCFPPVVFGHRVRDVAHAAKAFDPSAVELAAYRHPDEISWSEYHLARRDIATTGHQEAQHLDVAAWIREMKKANPILATIGHCRPDRWLTFHDIVSAYHQVCAAAGWTVMQSVLNECLRQAPPKYHDLGTLNARDLEFMASIHLHVPPYE